MTTCRLRIHVIGELQTQHAHIINISMRRQPTPSRRRKKKPYFLCEEMSRQSNGKEKTLGDCEMDFKWEKWKLE